MNVRRLVQQHQNGGDDKTNRRPFETPQEEHAQGFYPFCGLCSIGLHAPSATETDIYSVRNATIGLTLVARRAGTKQEAAATAVRRPATAK